MAMVGAVCTLGCLLTNSSPAFDAVVIVLAEPICREVGLTRDVVNAKVD